MSSKFNNKSMLTEKDSLKLCSGRTCVRLIFFLNQNKRLWYMINLK